MSRRGEDGEAIAAQFLERRGLRLIERNYRCRYGEIDLVVRDGATLVFVEVRQRTGSGFGGAAESITAAKRRRLLAAARHYLARHDTAPPCRFDALLLGGGPDPRIDWIRDAFGE